MTERDAYGARHVIVKTPRDLIDPIMDEFTGRRIVAREGFRNVVREMVRAAPRPAPHRVRGK